MKLNLEKSFRSNNLWVNWLSVKWPIGQLTPTKKNRSNDPLSNFFSVKWHFLSKEVSVKLPFSKKKIGQMTFRWDKLSKNRVRPTDFSIKWRSVKFIRWNIFSVKWTRTNFARDFEWPELRVLQKNIRIPLEVLVERKPEKFSKFRANYHENFVRKRCLSFIFYLLFRRNFCFPWMWYFWTSFSACNIIIFKIFKKMENLTRKSKL
jgi:hypothetical protein